MSANQYDKCGLESAVALHSTCDIRKKDVRVQPQVEDGHVTPSILLCKLETMLCGIVETWND